MTTGTTSRFVLWTVYVNRIDADHFREECILLHSLNRAFKLPNMSHEIPLGKQLLTTPRSGTNFFNIFSDLSTVQIVDQQ